VKGNRFFCVLSGTISWPRVSIYQRTSDVTIQENALNSDTASNTMRESFQFSRESLSASPPRSLSPQRVSTLRGNPLTKKERLTAKEQKDEPVVKEEKDDPSKNKKGVTIAIDTDSSPRESEFVRPPKTPFNKEPIHSSDDENDVKDNVVEAECPEDSVEDRLSELTVPNNGGIVLNGGGVNGANKQSLLSSIGRQQASVRIAKSVAQSAVISQHSPPKPTYVKDTRRRSDPPDPNQPVRRKTALIDYDGTYQQDDEFESDCDDVGRP
jgi:hypothetical protein